MKDLDAFLAVVELAGHDYKSSTELYWPETNATMCHAYFGMLCDYFLKILNRVRPCYSTTVVGEV
jgi:hypothetical protein